MKRGRLAFLSAAGAAIFFYISFFLRRELDDTASFFPRWLIAAKCNSGFG